MNMMAFFEIHKHTYIHKHNQHRLHTGCDQIQADRPHENGIRLMGFREWAIANIEKDRTSNSNNNNDDYDDDDDDERLFHSLAHYLGNNNAIVM